MFLNWGNPKSTLVFDEVDNAWLSADPRKALSPRKLSLLWSLESTRCRLPKRLPSQSHQRTMVRTLSTNRKGLG